MIKALVWILSVILCYSAIDYMFGKKEDERRNVKMIVITSLLIVLACVVNQVYFS